jgi:hypothetical protein
MSETVQIEPSAVQAHLSIMQSVIQRMAANSTGAKTWCVTLVSAILVVVADKDKPQLVWIAGIPTILFMILDAYYLGLERGFRRSYNDFIDAFHAKTLRPSSLYAVEISGQTAMLTLHALVSFSVLPFYLVLLISLFVATNLLK